MIALFSNSLAYVGASRSDGISTSVLEAMSAGAFPIQTDSSCSSEWLAHNQTGYLVPVGAVATIEEAVAGVLEGKYDLEESRRANARKLVEKADPTKLRALSINSYRQALKGSTAS
jgi:glycosyltransferase involved in cell wall biosynthesis